MLLRAHQLAGGEAGNARLPVPPWHGASHLPSSLKARTIFMALTKQDGGAVRQKPVQELPTETVCETLGMCGGHVSFLFFFFPFLFSFVLFFFVILLPFFYSFIAFW